MKKVLLTEPYPAEIAEAKPLKRLRKVAEIRVAPGVSETQLIEEVVDVDALLVRARTRLTRRIIDSAEVLKVICRTGVGVDNIEVDAATQRGIYVCNVPTVNANAVTEHTFCLILALAKNLLEVDKCLRAKGWACRERLSLSTIELDGKIIGIIGLGNIGSKVAIRAKAFGMVVLVCDPYISIEKAANVGVKLVDLDTLLKESDFVTIHSNLTEETRDLIDRSKIGLMKKTAFLVNCARGPIVNEDALIDSLKEGIIAGAAIDVFESEPVDPQNRLLKLENVIVTPHIAAMPYDVRVKALEVSVNDIIRVFSGEAPRNLVNPQVLTRETD